MSFFGAMLSAFKQQPPITEHQARLLLTEKRGRVENVASTGVPESYWYWRPQDGPFIDEEAA